MGLGVCVGGGRGNLRISQVQTSLVMSEYEILQILSVFGCPHTMTFTLQSKFYICAWALTGNFLKTSIQILQGTFVTVERKVLV